MEEYKEMEEPNLKNCSKKVKDYVKELTGRNYHLFKDYKLLKENIAQETKTDIYIYPIDHLEGTKKYLPNNTRINFKYGEGEWETIQISFDENTKEIKIRNDNMSSESNLCVYPWSNNVLKIKMVDERGK